MRGKSVTLEQLEVTYPNGFKAVHPTDLVIQAGEFSLFLARLAVAKQRSCGLCRDSWNHLPGVS